MIVFTFGPFQAGNYTCGVVLCMTAAKWCCMWTYIMNIAKCCCIWTYMNTAKCCCIWTYMNIAKCCCIYKHVWTMQRGPGRLDTAYCMFSLSLVFFRGFHFVRSVSLPTRQVCRYCINKQYNIWTFSHKDLLVYADQVLSVSTCVCVCVFVHACVCARVRACVCACVRVSVLACICVCLCECVCGK